MLVASALAIAGGGLAAEGPRTSSPGSPTGAATESRCPAFSWSAVSGAGGYEIVVYEVRRAGSEEPPVLRRTLAGAATLWTPPLEACFERGARYAWSVRALLGRTESEWSAPSLFEVAPGVSGPELAALLEPVGRALAAADGVAGAATLLLAPARPATGLTEPGNGPTALAAVADPAVQVNGAAVITTATLGAGLCEALTYRFVDRGDGTILDCASGKSWLKDADCLGQWPWSDADPTSTAFAKVAELNGGADFGCSDYAPGTYADWEVPSLTDFCSAGNALGSGVCPAGSAPDSLIDSTVPGFTKVENARGNGAWEEGDAFVGVRSDRYWTSSCFESCLLDAYAVYLFDGSFAPGGQTPLYWVWPVRSGP